MSFHPSIFKHRLSHGPLLSMYSIWLSIIQQFDIWGWSWQYEYISLYWSSFDSCGYCIVPPTSSIYGIIIYGLDCNTQGKHISVFTSHILRNMWSKSVFVLASSDLSAWTTQLLPCLALLMVGLMSRIKPETGVLTYVFCWRSPRITGGLLRALPCL